MRRNKRTFLKRKFTAIYLTNSDLFHLEGEWTGVSMIRKRKECLNVLNARVKILNTVKCKLEVVMSQ